MPSRTSEKGGEREAPRAEQKDRRRHHHHRSSRSKRAEPKDGSEHIGIGGLEAGNGEASDGVGPRVSVDVPELLGRGSSSSPMTSRASLPYPSFSKAHSREAVNSREDLGKSSGKNVYTPDPTDLQQQAAPLSHPKPNVPPSPPLTAESSHALDPRGKESPGKTTTSNNNNNNNKKEGHVKRRKASRVGATEGIRTTERADIENSSVQKETSSSPMRKSRSMTPIKGIHPMPATVDDGSSVLSGPRRTKSISPASSNRTSIAPQQPKVQAPYSPGERSTPYERVEVQSPPKTPTPRGTPAPPSHIASTHIQVVSSPGSEESAVPPPPPPPPPPPVPSGDVPRVDYLLQHGGLSRPVTKHYLSAPTGQEEEAVFTVGELPNPTTMAKQVEQFFSPFSCLLDDYAKVVSKNGSIAVATGYKSIARRLLSRLEAVFARNISSEACSCVICSNNVDPQSSEIDTGVSWGEVLEYVSGRQDLPKWPPLTLHNAISNLGSAATDFKVPMQKLDIDVPEEYREHYIRQSKKTKQSVDRWLAGQTDTVAPPDEADDDTLTFAILTHLTSEERRYYSQMIGLTSSRPPSVALGMQTSSNSTPSNQDLLSQTGIAIQRLYRLSSKPRQPECALFLLRNASLHGVLATLAAISDAEWDILVSGRFDGFLRSGAEDLMTPETGSPLQPRSSTPVHLRRPSIGPSSPATPAPATTGGPVALDEDTEIATLAEVEREIFLGMEALEDAFEALHTRAEAIRRTLRDRGAGLAMQAQIRKGSAATAVEARLGTPASMRGFDSETDDGMDDAMSELAPDDSASNVSRSRVRRPRRRTERRTPAPVEEEEEEGVDAGRAGRGPHAQSYDPYQSSRNAPKKR